MQQNKVVILVAAAVIVLLVAGFAGYKLLGKDANSIANAASSEEIAKANAETAAKIMAAVGPLGDEALGDKNAPITVVEYGSLTCSHCADFDKESFPELKSKYIDTGKVYYIFREFSFDQYATSAFMLSRCAGNDRYFGFLDVIFHTQNEWLFNQDDPIVGLLAIAKQGGFTDATFDACMKNKAIFDHIQVVTDRAKQEFKVASTPTFFINGEKVEGALPFSQFENFLKKHLPSQTDKPASGVAPAKPN